ncbi:MAG: winged helix-turn-helix transcriptional regulator [Halobacteriales archaeon]|nr:winged helix-turn-helix transcriptional regulator [Halobacteriales archaeon]
MRAAPLLSVALLLASSAAAAPIPRTEVRFSSPALLDGGLHATFAGQLFALAPPPGGPAFSVVLETDMEGVLTNRTGGYAYVRSDQGGGSYPLPEATESQWMAMAKGTRISLARPGGGSVLIEAGRITVEATAQGARLVPAPANGDLAQLLPAQRGEVMEHHRILVDPAESVLALGEVADSPLRVTVAGLRSISWTNAEVSCPAAPCPPGGQWTSRDGTAAGAVVKEGTVSYEEFVSAEGGRAVATGAASQLLLAAREATYAVNGSLRLPSASADLGCPACLGSNHTLLAAGGLSLERVRHDEEGRMVAAMGGDILAARLDEQAVDLPLLLGRSALGVGVVASVALGLKLVASALFTKLKGDPLEHPRRRRMFEYIQAHPGATFREVARAVGVATGTTRHHLSVLKRNGVVMERTHGSTTRFFENHGKFDASWSSVVLLREEPLRDLHDWLVAHPSVPQKDVLEGMAGVGWSRSTTQHRLERLVAGGVVELRLQGRLRIYRSKAAAPSAGLLEPSA